MQYLVRFVIFANISGTKGREEKMHGNKVVGNLILYNFGFNKFSIEVHRKLSVSTLNLFLFFYYNFCMHISYCSSLSQSPLFTYILT